MEEFDAVAQTERALLGVLLEKPDAWRRGLVGADDFLLEDHRRIWRTISALNAEGLTSDIETVTTKLLDMRSRAYVSDLVYNGAVPANLEHYAREVRRAASERKFARLYEQLGHAGGEEQRAALLTQLQDAHQCNGQDTQDGELIVIRGDNAAEKPLRWMWKPYIPLGKLTHFGGNSSQAKSPVTIDLAARISTGSNWPDGTPNEQGSRSIILLNIEDDLEDTILPRYRLAGGDKSKLYYVKGVRVPGKANALQRGMTLESDMQHLAKLARSLPDLGIIIVDPITNYLGGKKMIVEEDVRALLTPLSSLAAELGIVVITVGHFNRREKGTDPLHRMMGAAAFTGVARAVYAFGPDPEEESKYCHVMSVVRSCGGDGPALRYRTELVTEHCPDSFSTEIVKVVWTGKSDATAEDVVDSASALEKTREHEAARTLKNFLRDGRKSAAECTATLKDEGYDLEKLNAGRIRRKAGADSKKFAGDKFYSWYLLTPV